MHAPGQNAPHFSFADFFARSTRMESVDLDSNAFSKSSFLQNLRGLPPTLQRLGVHDRMNGWGIPSVFDDEALAVLTPAQSCPALQQLFVFHGFSISDAALLRFITAKMTSESGTTLMRVDVQFDRYMLLDIFPSLQPFIETGLDVSITHLPLPTSQFSPWQGLSDAPDTWDSSDNYW
jgi:hypothetical protein